MRGKQRLRWKRSLGVFWKYFAKPVVRDAARFLGFPTEVKVNKKRLQDTVLGAVIFVLLIRGCGWLATRAGGSGTAGAGTVAAGAGTAAAGTDGGGRVEVDARTGKVHKPEQSEQPVVRGEPVHMTPDEAEQWLDRLMGLYRELVANSGAARPETWRTWGPFLRDWNQRFSLLREELDALHARSGWRSGTLNLLHGLAGQILMVRTGLAHQAASGEPMDPELLKLVEELERDVREEIGRCRKETPPSGC